MFALLKWKCDCEEAINCRRTYRSLCCSNTKYCLVLEADARPVRNKIYATDSNDDERDAPGLVQEFKKRGHH